MAGDLLALSRLASSLASAAGRSAVVCLGCPLEVPLPHLPLALTRYPLERLPLRLQELLLAVLHLECDEESLLALALAAVPELWLFDEVEGWMERLTAPASGRYRRRDAILPGERVTLAGLPAVTLVPLPRA